MANTSVFKASYKIIKEKKLIVEFCSGSMTLESMKLYKLQQSLDVDFSPDYDLFADAYDVELTATMNQVSDYVDFVIDNGNIIGNRKNATLINTLNQKVYMSYFSQLNDKRRLPQNVKLFTDMQAALDWLDKDVSLTELTAVLDELKNSSQFVWYADKNY